jgi:signal transduction histidine kinase
VENELPWYSDSLRVKTIVSNIFSNAIKYQDFNKNDPFIKISTRTHEDYCDIRIEDNGIGIESESQQKIFDLFFRATDQSKGTGLGLFIVKDTIARLKGTVEVKSTVGHGTTFAVRIPNQLNQPAVVA